MFEIDTSELNAFSAQLKRAEQLVKKDLAKWLEEMATDFLEAVAEEIIAVGSFDTGELLESFGRGGSGNTWQVDAGGLTLKVGTNIKYADWVNTGHFQRPGRFVPGEWNGNKFTYIPGHSKGMVLKQAWVEGTHYWDDAVIIFERLFPKRVEQWMEEWLERNFV